MTDREIDRDKVRNAVRKLGNKYVYSMLDEAIDMLPNAKLLRLVSRFLDSSKLRSDGKGKGTVRAAVQAFEKASLGREYFEAFDVNSKNCMEQSTGTTAWIAECCRLLDRCVAQGKRGEAAEARQSFEIIFGLLDRIDAYPDDIIFFAEVDGKPAGMSLALPDANVALKAAHGRMFPFGIIKMLLATKRIHRVRVLSMGVVKEFRNRGIDLAFYYYSYKYGVPKGYWGAEMSWVEEDNTSMNNTAAKLNGKRYRTYRVWEHAL